MAVAVAAAVAAAVVKTKFYFTACLKNGCSSFLNKDFQKIALDKEMTPVNHVLTSRENGNFVNRLSFALKRC